MKNLVLICALVGTLEIYGSSVEWGSFAIVDVAGCPTIGYVGATLHTDTSVSLKLTQKGCNLNISESGYTSLISFSDWTLAYLNEIVFLDMFDDESRVYLWKDGPTGNSFDVNASEDVFYLAFKTQLWKDYEFTVKDGETYGWVRVGVQDGALTLQNSAISLDGFAMYVGGGAVSVPEPTTALLVLIGGVGAFLKRRRRALRASRTFRISRSSRSSRARRGMSERYSPSDGVQGAECPHSET